MPRAVRDDEVVGRDLEALEEPVLVAHELPQAPVALRLAVGEGLGALGLHHPGRRLDDAVVGKGDGVGKAAAELVERALVRGAPAATAAPVPMRARVDRSSSNRGEVGHAFGCEVMTSSINGAPGPPRQRWAARAARTLARTMSMCRRRWKWASEYASGMSICRTSCSSRVELRQEAVELLGRLRLGERHVGRLHLAIPAVDLAAGPPAVGGRHDLEEGKSSASRGSEHDLQPVHQARRPEREIAHEEGGAVPVEAQRLVAQGKVGEVRRGELARALEHARAASAAAWRSRAGGRSGRGGSPDGPPGWRRRASRSDLSRGEIALEAQRAFGKDEPGEEGNSAR